MKKLLLAALATGLTATSSYANEANLLSALSALQGHVDGTSLLTPTQIGTHQATVISNKTIFGDTAAVINASFNLVSAYESSPSYGPLWAAGSAQDTFDRTVDNSQDFDWTIYQVMQNIVDDTYNSTNLTTHAGLLTGYGFQTGSVVPGPVNQPTFVGTHTVSIDASFIDTVGRDTQNWTNPARKATGTAIAPGTVATLTVPADIVGKGYQVRVGTHTWDMSSNNRRWVDRLDRSTVVYSINSTTLQVASPLGGNLYIEVPFGADEGVVNIDIQNASRSPFFSLQDHFQTTVADWQNIERNFASPWTDLQTEKVLIQVPTGWVYALSDPTTALENWDKAADVTNMLMGFPTDRGKETIYNQVDVRTRASVYAPGYPAVNNTYEPLNNQDASGWNTRTSAFTGTTNSYLITGPQFAPDYEFHELGHAYFFPKFDDNESTVNLLHVAVMQKAFGKSWDESFAGSLGFQGNPNRTINNTAVAWMTSFNFSTNHQEMAAGEEAYQLKGHAKFVEYARLFSWEALGAYYQGMMTDGYNNSPSPAYDEHVIRLSKAAGVDVTPLMHFWGDYPDSYASIKSQLDAEGIGKSREIFELLKHYKTLVPEDNAAFQAYALGWWGKQPSINGNWTEREHARQFDATELFVQGGDIQRRPDGEIYNEATAADIHAVIDGLLREYYLEFLADFNGDESLNGADWVIFITNAQSDMSALTPEQALARGDLDGDMDNDIYDFDLFRKAYELANPQPGAFIEMVLSTNVPEPGSLAFLAIGGAMLATARRGSSRPVHPD